jgi:hypothetical protein
MEAMTESAEEWAQRHFGDCKLGDRRRTKRAVQLAASLLRAPSKSLPQQLQSWGALKGAYRLLGQPGVSYPALIQPHLQQTRMKVQASEAVVLLIQDLAEVDYSHHPTTEGLGPIGDGRGQGYLLATVLAVRPEPRQVLGIMHQDPFLRKPRPPKETAMQRARRPKESDFWLRSAQAIGRCPPGQCWVHVGDRGSDLYTFLEGCRALDCHFLIRASYDRKMVDADGLSNHLLTFARQLPAQDEQAVDLPAGHGHPARQTRLKLAFSGLTLTPNWLHKHRSPIDAWVIRVWEEQPGPEIPNPVDWYLLTSLPTETVGQAWLRVDWYRDRWLAEDFHQCLKTGCQIEQRHFREKDRLLRLLGLLAPVAVQLLSLREAARLEPERPAHQVLPADLVRVVAHLAHQAPETITLHDFWRLVAQKGGFLGRQRDGPPGWKSLWTGWLYLQNLLDGVRLAAQLRSPPL